MCLTCRVPGRLVRMPPATSAPSWWRTPRPGLVVALLIATGVEALALWGYTAIGAVSLMTGGAEHVGIAVALLVCSAGGAALMTASVKALGYAQAWSRGPLITIQLLAILVGVSLLQAGVTATGVTVIVWCVLVLVLLFSSEVTRFTGMRGPESRQGPTPG